MAKGNQILIGLKSPLVAFIKSLQAMFTLELSAIEQSHELHEFQLATSLPILRGATQAGSDIGPGWPFHDEGLFLLSMR